MPHLPDPYHHRQDGSPADVPGRGGPDAGDDVGGEGSEFAAGTDDPGGDQPDSEEAAAWYTAHGEPDQSR